jgi:hypothetical protein
MRLIPTALAITVGLFTLLDFFFAHPLLDIIGAAFRDWAIILTAFALLLGLGNLLFVHFLRVTRRNEPGAGYSAIVLIVTLVVFGAGLWFTLPSSEMAWLFNHVYLPLQGAFFALTAFFLATAAYRAMRARNVETTLMLIAAVIVFIGQMPLAGVLADAREWILRVPSEAGLRGIMLGVALGTLATALRLIVGMDRPYSE